MNMYWIHEIQKLQLNYSKKEDPTEGQIQKLLYIHLRESIRCKYLKPIDWLQYDIHLLDKPNANRYNRIHSLNHIHASFCRFPNSKQTD